LVFLVEEQRKPNPVWKRAIRVAKEALRDAPLADERQPDDVARRLRRFAPRRQTLHIPPRRLVPARGALQRNSPLFEVQQRIVPVKAAQELPHVPSRPADRAGLLRWCMGWWLPGFGPHCRVPLSFARRRVSSQ
jgi:hypothetical protein